MEISYLEENKEGSVSTKNTRKILVMIIEWIHSQKVMGVPIAKSIKDGIHYITLMTTRWSQWMRIEIMIIMVLRGQTLSIQELSWKWLQLSLYLIIIHNNCGFHNPLETCQARKININEKNNKQCTRTSNKS